MPNDKILGCKREKDSNIEKTSKSDSDHNTDFVDEGLENQDFYCKKENRFSNNSSSGFDFENVYDVERWTQFLFNTTSDKVLEKCDKKPLDSSW